MFLIGLTGGIGSGKSTVAQLFAKHGYTIVDADQIAREIVQPGQPALAELAINFGADIVSSDGTLNRGLLATRAFANPENTTLLNKITHPRIATETQRQFEQARQQGVRVAVYDMPLLVDKGLDKDMNFTVVIDVAPEIRVARLVAQRGLGEEDARRRIAAQISDAERNRAADFLIDNNGDLASLALQVAEVIERIDAAAIAAG